MTRVFIEAPGQVEAEVIAFADADRLLIGRTPQPSCLQNVAGPVTRSLAIASPHVSANHALLWSTGTELVIQDLASRNGTWVRVPRDHSLRISGGDEVRLRLAPSTWASGPEHYPEPARYRSAADFGDSIAQAIRTWLTRHDIQAEVWCGPSSEVGPGVSAFGLSIGQFVCVRPDRTVDGLFHERLAQLSRYVSTQNSLFAAEEQTRGDGMILASPAIRQVHRRVAELALQSMPSLILLGPSGTGKERLAGAFHRCLARGGAFIPINCATLTRERMVADLFGAEAGAYTDAKRTLVGAVERADGGTLFLDEIGEMPLDVQPMLLRFLETGEYQRLGGVGRSRFADVRVVAATNRDLRSMAHAGTFREDLFFRLALELIEVPPLRERLADVDAYLQCQMLGAVSIHEALVPAALEVVRGHSWPGNFRELVNFGRRLPRTAAPASLDTSLVLRTLQAGSLAPVRISIPPEPLTPSTSDWTEWLQESADAFLADEGQPPESWSSMTTFIEQYLKPWALVNLANLANVHDLAEVSVTQVAERVKADRGTVAKQLRRYLECKRSP